MIFGDKYIKRYLLILIFFIVSFTAILKITPIINTPEKCTKRIQSEFIRTEKIFDNISNNVFRAMEIDSMLSWNDIETITRANNCFTLIFKRDSLIFWNGNSVNPEKVKRFNPNKTGIYHLKNGWFIISNYNKNIWSVVLYKPLMIEYPFKNDYLKGNTNNNFIGDNNISFKTAGNGNYNLIYDSNKNPVIAIDFENFSPYNHFTVNLLFYIYGGIYLIILLLIIRVYQLLIHHKLHVLTGTGFLLIDTFLLWLLMTIYTVPVVLKSGFWFQPWHTVFPLVDSRGAVVFLITFIILISINFYKNVWRIPYKIEASLKNIALIAFVNFAVLFFLLFIFKAFYELTVKPNDDAIGFLFRKDFVELFFISGIVVSIFFYQISFIRLMDLKTETVTYYSLFSLIYILAAYLFIPVSYLFYISVFFIQVLTVAIIYYTSLQQGISFLRYLLLTVLLAIGFSVIINDSWVRHKNMLQTETVKYLKTNRDYFLEGKFYILRNDLMNDITFKNMVNSNYPDDSLLNYLYLNYLDKSFKNYDIQLTVCNEGDTLEIQPEGNRVNCKEYFNFLTDESSLLTIDTSLRLMKEVGENRYYLGNLNLKNDTTGHTTLYIEMFSSIVPTGPGYPVLLVDKNNQIDLSGYSIAKFHQNVLVYKLGEYDYHSSYSFMQQYPNNRFYYLNKYLHYKIRVNGNDVLVVSRPVRSLSGQLSTFSFMFLLFSVLAVLIWFISVGGKQSDMLRYSFRARLQLFIISTLLLLFVLMSVITIYYFNDIRKTFIINQLNEKTKSVLVELQDKFTKENFTTDMEELYLSEQLQKLSMVFFTDINIYKNSGILKATSRPKVFETGLLSGLINPESYQQIMINKKLFFITEEKTGTLSYFSAYVPLNFDAVTPAAILNLPYFARETEVKKSFLPMLYNYLNIFVIIGIIGTLLALVISRILTRPLAMLKQSLSEINIDKKNEPLVWKNNDEIGLLIAEYNKMVEKIEESAKLLKRSERETAWREIAQQVAHEIRNPLTPMKLNIQYLQKIYTEPQNKFDEKWKTLSASLIDQIDALNEVASTFFDLASRSASGKSNIDIIKLISSAIDLYHNHDNVNIVFNTDLKEAPVLGRQSELLRVFNNLIKNAVQSLGPQGGKVSISVTGYEGHFVIKIIDSGKGIPEEMKESIFQPYFTTKSGGTGLGLAIVKNIINEMGGEISFRSEKNRGTEFLIRLPGIK